MDKIALLKRFCGNDTIIVEVQIFKGHDLYGRKYKENTKADRKCYRERKQDRNGSHLAAAAPVLFPILFGTFFQQLYNAADAVIVGRFVGKEALSAVGGGTGTLIQLLVGFS